MNVVVVIPAFNPSPELVGFVQRLAETEIRHIIVVNDGSAPSCDGVFKEIAAMAKVTLRRHAVNLGKGAALKTGLNHAYLELPDAVGVVTADADGQHLPEDVVKVGKALCSDPDRLVVGSRGFDRNVPLRSKFGNIVTRHIFWFLVGKKLTDTQSGLRGIPMDMIPTLLRIESNGYEFELDMLIACKREDRGILEQRIATVYLNGNRSSHFNPLIDSIKIYFTLLRFMISSMLTAVIDYIIFLFVFSIGSNILLSQAAARFVALIFNYAVNRKLVFLSKQQHTNVFPKYVMLVILSGLVSYSIIELLLVLFPLQVAVAKLISEGIIYFGNFAVQRDFIFKGGRGRKQTDWDAYYRRPYRTAAYSRKITTRVLLDVIRRFAPHGGRGLRIAELGGGGSCFYEAIRDVFSPREYHVIDNNRVGLEVLKARFAADEGLVYHERSVFDPTVGPGVDVAFSVGLIEHFPPEDTRRAVEAHFRLVEEGGVVILSFPTPTLLYRLSRFAAEMVGLWIFHDERPLQPEEVLEAAGGGTELLYRKTIWPIFLTQCVLVLRKNTGEGLMS